MKYQRFLDKFTNCPPDDFIEIERYSFRWTHQNAAHDNDFKPLNLITNPPQRVLDDSDLMCKGYGLSLYDSRDGSLNAYKNQYYRRTRKKQIEKFIEDKGDCIAILNVTKSDGLAGKPEVENYGHFTFHEYDECDLKTRLINLFNIFDANGEFNEI